MRKYCLYAWNTLVSHVSFHLLLHAVAQAGLLAHKIVFVEINRLEKNLICDLGM